MKFLFDLFPAVLFLATYLVTDDLFVATAVVIPAALIQIAYVWLRHRKVGKMLLASVILVVVMGGLTLYLHDQRFIIWKPTVLYWLFSLVFSMSILFWKKNIIRSMLEKEIQLPDREWSVLNWTWVVFFTLMGFANLYVAYNFSLRFWAAFKVWGTLGASVVLVFAQTLYLARFVEEKKNQNDRPADAP